MQWSPHINSLAIKASKVLNFVKHNSYLSLVRPIMEYASCVWDPNEIVNNQALEKVQRRGARWVLSDYGRHSSVTRTLTQLGRSTLQHRCFISRLILLMDLFLCHFHLIFY